MSFSDYVELHIFKPCGMEQSGYFTLDALPANCALGYIEEENGSWRSNIYSIPVKGGADGGAFVTAPDMQLFWNGLMNHTLLSPVLTSLLLTPHIHVDGEGYYGYGVWITLREKKCSSFILWATIPVFPSDRLSIRLVERLWSYYVIQAAGLLRFSILSISICSCSVKNVKQRASY